MGSSNRTGSIATVGNLGLKPGKDSLLLCLPLRRAFEPIETTKRGITRHAHPLRNLPEAEAAIAESGQLGIESGIPGHPHAPEHIVTMAFDLT